MLPGAVTGRLREALTDADITWSVPEPVALWALIVPIVGSVIVAATWGYRPLFHFLTDEDSLLEWQQFACDLLAAIVAGLVALRLRAKGYGRVPIVLWALFAVGCFFIAGEEISWGQRIFGWGTPHDLAKVNDQDETTLHNIRAALDTINIGMLLAGLYGLAAPLLLRTRRYRHLTASTWLFVPPLFLSSAFGLMFVYKALRITIFTAAQSATVSFGEWPESCLALSLLVFGLLIHRRLRDPQNDPAAPVEPLEAVALEPQAQLTRAPA